MASFVDNQKTCFDDLPEVIMYHMLTFCDSLTLAKAAPTSFFLHVLSRYLLTKTPNWRTLHLPAGNASGIADAIKLTQQAVESKITLCLFFANNNSVLKGAAHAAKLLPKNAVALGCMSMTSASVANLPFFSDEQTAIEGSATYGTVTLANIPETDCVVFEIPNNKATSGDAMMAHTPKRSDGGAWNVIILLIPRGGNPRAEYLNKLHAANPGVEVIGGIHAGQTTFMLKEGVVTNNASIVGVCVGGNVVYSSQITRACRPLGGVSTVTRCGALKEGDPADEDDGMALVMEVLDEEGKRQMAVNGASKAYNGMQELGAGMIYAGITNDLNKGFSMRDVRGQGGPGGNGLIVSGTVNDGDKLQYFTLCPDSSRQDLIGRLDACRKRTTETAEQALGCVLISCAGRGENIYGKPHVESEIFAAQLPGVGMSGFFSGGEIGPQARAMLPYDSTFRGRTALQEFTSVFGVFYVPRFLTPTAHVWEDAIKARTIIF